MQKECVYSSIEFARVRIIDSSPFISPKIDSYLFVYNPECVLSVLSQVPVPYMRPKFSAGIERPNEQLELGRDTIP